MTKDSNLVIRMLNNTRTKGENHTEERSGSYAVVTYEIKLF